MKVLIPVTGLKDSDRCLDQTEFIWNTARERGIGNKQGGLTNQRVNAQKYTFYDLMTRLEIIQKTKHTDV